MGENAVRTSCYHLVKKGIIKRPRRGMYELVEKSELEVQKQMKEPREDSGEPQSSKQSERRSIMSSLFVITERNLSSLLFRSRNFPLNISLQAKTNFSTSRMFFASMKTSIPG